MNFAPFTFGAPSGKGVLRLDGNWYEREVAATRLPEGDKAHSKNFFASSGWGPPLIRLMAPTL